MPPGQIVMLIQFYCFPFTEQIESFNSTMGQSWISSFIDMGLLQQVGAVDHREHGYEVTTKGRIHINNLCSLELPRRVWV